MNRDTPKNFKNIAILYREDKPQAKKLAVEISSWLLKNKKSVFTAPGVSKLPKTATLENINDIDMMVVLGGDGTYLNAVRLLDGKRIPVLGANFGHTGFLTETLADNLIPFLRQVLKGNVRPQERAMIEGQIIQKSNSSRENGPKVVRKFTALNDVVVERGSNTHLIDMSIFFGDSLVSRFRADGLIVATPTGSTAYSLSAGGPILHPEVGAMVVTPVCPHSLTARSIVLSDDRPIQIRLNNPDQSALFMADGHSQIEITPEQEVWLEKSKHRHLMLSSQDYDYFHRLNEKLQFGQRH